MRAPGELPSTPATNSRPPAAIAGLNGSGTDGPIAVRPGSRTATKVISTCSDGSIRPATTVARDGGDIPANASR